MKEERKKLVELILKDLAFQDQIDAGDELGIKSS